MPFNGLLFGLELEGAACQLCQAECLRAAILLHRKPTQSSVNNTLTEVRIVYFRSILLKYNAKRLANRSNGLKNNETKHKPKLLFFSREYDEMCDTGSSVNHSSLQSAYQVKRGEEREQEPIRHKPWPIQTLTDCY